jgi:HSP20 family protein
MLERNWNPFGDLAQAQEQLDRLAGAFSRNAWVPPLDVRETESGFVVTVDLPGLDPRDVEVMLEDGVLTVRGEREFRQADEQAQFHRIERSYGSFARSIRLPRVADTERVEASFDKGVLTIEIAKREEAKPRTIAVKGVNEPLTS